MEQTNMIALSRKGPIPDVSHQLSGMEESLIAFNLRHDTQGFANGCCWVMQCMVPSPQTRSPE
jgi:hypothetical protein